ncbi:MAG: ribosome assembly RNA-binding protein YhbY [Lachnospiraceae bacterium]|jgi:putative RNA-binding protein, YhbY family|nr:ribosome assembly RNA-binding protein YhbY [Lachnospiraceae bacterium]MCI9369467.1 ribosome assembly RNA-binding protein YhbY [Lachnospiraceae bacterium]
MTSKRRAYLKGCAMTLDTILHIGKSGVTPEITQSVQEALEARELVKLNILKNCMYDIREIAETLADRTHSEVIQVIGRKIILFKEAKENSKYAK